MWVPAGSVVQAQSGIFVVKNESNFTKKIPVQTGIAKDSLTEVFGNLQAGDKILLKVSEEIKEGVKIAIAISLFTWMQNKTGQNQF